MPALTRWRRDDHRTARALLARSPSLEQLAFEAAQRALDKQEELLEELRARTGVLLAAASLAASFLGTRALEDPPATWLVGMALIGFLVTIGASVHALTPKSGFIFALSGPKLYEEVEILALAALVSDKLL